MVRIECIVTYDDMQLGKRIKMGDTLDVTKERADYLVNERGLAKVIEVIPEEVKIEETPEVKEEVKPVSKKKRK